MKKNFKRSKSAGKENTDLFEKIQWKPGNMLYPLPVVLVSCGTKEKPNIITVAWTGIINTNPPMCYISIRPKRYSYKLIKETMEFCINLTTKELAYATDWCGVKSGKYFDKFKEMKLTPLKCEKIKAPMIGESPVNIECRVTEIKKMESHDMFIAEIISVNVSKKYLNEKTDEFDLSKVVPICYSHGKYYESGKLIGKFGYSVRKKKKSKKNYK